MLTVNEPGLRQALEEGQIVPYFQPLMELRTGRISGFEVLARWVHPVHGLISPSEFIPLAESSGLIDPMTESLIEQASLAASAWPENLTLSVNISPLQLQDTSLPERIFAAASRGNFPLSRLILEITERAQVEDIAAVRPLAEELKKLGARLALDDFGTGYSSLRYLHALPFDELKIDMSFVRSMIQERESRKIVASTIGLGRSLHLETVAEGVETQEQADMLLALGCDIGQGWLFGRPMPESQVADHLARQTRVENRKSSTIPEVASGLEALPMDHMAQLQAIYHAVPVGLRFVDTSLRTVSVNQRMADICGIPASKYLGRTMEEVLPDLSEEIEPYIRRALSGEAITNLELLWRMPGQSAAHTYVVSYYPARDEAQEIVGVSICVIDATSNVYWEQQGRPKELTTVQ
jgi:PAS domain S-box-containing protein